MSHDIPKKSVANSLLLRVGEPAGTFPEAEELGD
jgi:hypothetical protein